MIDYKFKEILEECLSFAEKFLTRPDDLQVILIDYSSGKFEHENVPCFTSADGKVVVFNLDWINRSLPDYSDDVRFFIFHELRHVHQKYQIAKLHLNEKTDESKDTLAQWELEFCNYQTNYGDEISQDRNLAQEVELDANAYAIAMLNLKYLGIQNWSYKYSLPRSAYDKADKRCREYYKTRPELKRYCDKRFREMTGKSVYAKKPERNELCPCGSGKKFKHCCLGKSIYD